MNAYVIEALRQVDEGIRAWVEEDTAPTFECACDRADEIAAVGGIARVRYGGHLVYAVGTPWTIETEE